jgi:hypothetical protein
MMEIQVGTEGSPGSNWWILFNSLLRRFGEPFFPFAFADWIGKKCKLFEDPDPTDGHISNDYGG